MFGQKVAQQGLIPGFRQQGPDDPIRPQGPHAGNAVGSRTPNQTHEDGFGLIVPVMSENQQRTVGVFSQGGMAGLPRCGLKPARVITPDHHTLSPCCRKNSSFQ